VHKKEEKKEKKQYYKGKQGNNEYNMHKAEFTVSE
jgi:hypothetical protein